MALASLVSSSVGVVANNVGSDIQHFSWGYTAEFEGLSGSPDNADCINAFDVAFVDAWNEANAGGDVVAEGCTVNEAAPGLFESPHAGISVRGGNYHYNGGGDYR